LNFDILSISPLGIDTYLGLLLPPFHHTSCVCECKFNGRGGGGWLRGRRLQLKTNTKIPPHTQRAAHTHTRTRRRRHIDDVKFFTVYKTLSISLTLQPLCIALVTSRCRKIIALYFCFILFISFYFSLQRNLRRCHTLVLLKITVLH